MSIGRVLVLLFVWFVLLPLISLVAYCSFWSAVTKAENEKHTAPARAASGTPLKHHNKVAQASDWISLGKSGPDVELQIDVSSIKFKTLTPGFRSAWIKLIFPTHSKREGAGAWWAAQVSHKFFDCKEGRRKIDTRKTFFEDGATYTSPHKDDSPWESVVPGTVEDASMKFVCSWKTGT